jgi:hypothetical protein
LKLFRLSPVIYDRGQQQGKYAYGALGTTWLPGDTITAVQICLGLSPSHIVFIEKNQFQELFTNSGRLITPLARTLHSRSNINARVGQISRCVVKIKILKTNTKYDYKK